MPALCITPDQALFSVGLVIAALAFLCAGITLAQWFGFGRNR